MIKSCSMQINGQTLHLETGRIARQASGSAVVTLGETVVLVTAVSTDEVREGIDFLPLTVEYQEMSYAGGRIPGNFFRRDMGRPSEKETLTARLIDRPLRPLFPKNYHFETQVIASVLSTDKENEADVLAILGASAALEVSDIPFAGPIAGVRVGRVEGDLVANPTMSQLDKSDINLIVAGNRKAVVMVEGGGRFVSEADMIDAIFFGHEALQPMLDMQEELKAAAGRAKRPVTPAQEDHALARKVENEGAPLLRDVIRTADKVLRNQKRKEVTSAVIEKLSLEYEGMEGQIKDLLHDLERDMVRKMILEEGRRIDGRAFDEVRPIECMVGILPRVHGSALFTRGETQAMVLTTLGTEFDEQKIESIYGDDFRSFILHYNFPPYSVGEARRLGGPGRREIGHGALARRALLPVMPDKEAFGYSVRVVSEILESNGSSSMASVCGGSMSLMDAGVPIKEAVAGVAMGLVSGDGRIAVLTDIIGDEDHYGDMDFKVTGTRDGITALQMDIKMEGISREVMERALEQARVARLFIMDKMDQAISKARPEVSQYAPIILKTEIKPEKIRTVIGPGGKVIKHICSESGARVDVNDEGEITISASDQESAERALAMIEELVKEAEIGKLYMGKVVKITDFGAFVEILPGVDGLIHISQLDRGRVEKVSDVLQEGEKVLVKVLDVDEQGKVRLSRKAALGESLDDVS
ncbi:MAG: polyribonucleotide nucleotidyltransferase [Deltaproteobacteria bacterium]|nr:polyribonucleotide nucleotidyltransferase [Deltaproteobacteria bacterium]MBW1924242.1 polyribonucleotide nucleotidyltransferase [Deltaproteobacteria bacterium]MBW1949215.1 polyribonucleotide nucleotidyltransferase [Deltaproteobacteria bacterium]MBW2007190.1 polyribonucleotide nucleotidyltransferase [Deltaproteobacteria bacterium]MBW2346541.1 polyribonucleotide nucleotidyltransferase [Deltaproteobacteria bacterium]